MRGILQTRLSGIIALALVLGASEPAFAQMAPEQDAGWASDVEGLRHFSGMRCPDIVGQFYRTKALAGDIDRVAGCIYIGPGGMNAVLRQHLAGAGRSEAAKFQRSFKAAGFEQVTLSGAAQSGISFKTRTWTPTTLCETFWYFSGKKADFTLWLSYTLPTQEEDIAPAVTAFTEALIRQN